MPAPASPGSYTLIWQSDKPHEREWIEEIFRPLIGEQVTDTKHHFVTDNAILCDAFIYCFDQAYYRQFRGKNAILVHFLDENFEGLYDEYYANFRLVYRCFWSDVFNQEHIRRMPLGYSNGAGREGRTITPASQRPYLWSFAGQVFKGSRPDMAKALVPVKPRFFSATDPVEQLAFLPPADRNSQRLSREEFSALLFQSAFAPSPMGNVHIECYRPYEALEAGSIPIVEKRWTLDPYRELLGSHPLPTVRSWMEARKLLQHFQARPAEMDAVQTECMGWWAAFKERFSQEIVSEIRARAAAIPAPVRSMTAARAKLPGWRALELLRHHNAGAVNLRIRRQVNRLLREGKLRTAYRAQ